MHLQVILSDLIRDKAYDRAEKHPEFAQSSTPNPIFDYGLTDLG